MTDMTQAPEEIAQIFARHANQVGQLPEEKRAHFLCLLDLLLGCYVHEQNRGLLLVTEGENDNQRLSLVAINADSEQTEELVDNLCVFRKLDFSAETPAMN